MKGIEEVFQRHGRSPEVLLRVLLDLQEISPTNSLSEETLEIVAQEMGLSTVKVYEIATFYSMFRLGKKEGKFLIEVCKSAPCHVCGCQRVMSLLQNELGIHMEETTSDGRFTLTSSSCFGACNMGPAIKIGEKVYGNLNSQTIRNVLAPYREVAIHG